MALLMGSVCAGLSSCSVSDNEKAPEQVNDPISDKTEYYIVGRVTNSNGGVVSGATVSASGYDNVTTDANGNFTLTVSDRTSYTLKVSANNYMNANVSVTVPSGLSNRSSVPVSVELASKGQQVQLQANTAAIVDAKGKQNSLSNISEVGVSLPANTVSSNASITVTPYVQEAMTSSSTAAVMNVYVETAGVTETGNVTLAVKDPAGKQTFNELEVYKSNISRADNFNETTWTAEWDENTQTYQASIPANQISGDYSFRVPVNRQQGSTQTTSLGENKVDNSGNFAAMSNVNITYTATLGWTYTNAPSIDLLKNAIESIEGPEGTYNVNYTETTNVGGNSVMYWSAQRTSVPVTYTFNLKDGSQTYTLNKYTGVNFTYWNVSADQHSGGTSGAN